MKNVNARVFLLLVLTAALSIPGWFDSVSISAAQAGQQLDLRLPDRQDSVRFAVAGDAGIGGRQQREIGQQMAIWHSVFPFEFVLMPGDNLYGSEEPEDYRKKFEEPFSQLLAAQVKFYAALGNHDEPKQRFYEHFNMGGQRYYSFHKGNARFFALDSNCMSAEQVQWLEKELGESDELWKIVFLHHPLYSSGRHGSNLELRKVLEPLFVTNGVDVVIAGHEHFYQRIKPQKGITYFVSGAAGKLRKGDVKESDFTAAFFDTDRSFMLFEIVGETLHYQCISRLGETVDSGSLLAREVTPAGTD
ncbi:MAG TPA: metallophosphoesterase [Acidobacteriota bacterium]|nr:metallophosphoesterase [Acidobacteriota bacterium]